MRSRWSEFGQREKPLWSFGVFSACPPSGAQWFCFPKNNSRYHHPVFLQPRTSSVYRQQGRSRRAWYCSVPVGEIFSSGRQIIHFPLSTDASMLYGRFSTKTVDRYRIFALLSMSIRRQFVTHRVADLRLHPSYVRNGLTVSTSQLSALVTLGDQAFLDAVVTTRERFVIDGYALLELARQQGLLTLLCIELDLNETEGLQWLLWKSRQSNVLNAFSRILLALDLQPALREKARSDRRAFRQNKDLSKLTETEGVDVRSDVAREAGVSTGNVTKVNRS